MFLNSIASTMLEHATKHLRNQCLKYKCHLARIRSRAAVLVLLWDLLFQAYKIYTVFVVAGVLF